MTDTPTGSPEESLKPATNNIETGNALLGEYADIIDDYTQHATIARRMADFPAVVETVNNQLDRSTHALHAEAMHSTAYGVNPDDNTWQKLADYLVTGPGRPFVGDRLEVIEGDVLLLVDTARQLAISHFVNLQIRSKEDASVDKFSSEDAVGVLRKLGEAAREGDKKGIIMPNRWGQEKTDPDTGSG